jgi:hypothetical protein
MQELILTAIDARRLTDEVKADAKRLWAKLMSLYEGGAHIALGYTSWADYCEHEFYMSKSQGYRLLQAAQVVNQLARDSPIGESLKVTSQVPESEAIAREMVPLLRNPQALDEAWNEAVQEAGGDVPTAAKVKEVVSRKLATLPLEKKPLHDLEDLDPNLFKIATRAIGMTNELAKFVSEHKPKDVWQGLKEHEKSPFFANMLLIDEWVALMKLTVNSVSNGIPPAVAAQAPAKLTPERIPVLIRQANNLHIQGLSWAEIAKQWNAKGIPTTSGTGHWHGGTVAKLAANQ